MMNSEDRKAAIRERVRNYSAPPTPETLAALEARPLRVAAYAPFKPDDLYQVSSGTQARSYYEDMIASIPCWTMAGVYVDQCALSIPADQRPGFKALLEHVEEYDLVICKSFSRLDGDLHRAIGLLKTLAEKGVGFYFEMEDLSTLDESFSEKLELLAMLCDQESRMKSRVFIVPPYSDDRLENSESGDDRSEVGKNPMVIGSDCAQADDQAGHDGWSAESVRLAMERYVEHDRVPSFHSMMEPAVNRV